MFRHPFFDALLSLVCSGRRAKGAGVGGDAITQGVLPPQPHAAAGLGFRRSSPGGGGVPAFPLHGE